MFTRINTWLLSVNLLLVYFPVLFLDFTLFRLVLLDFCGDLVIILASALREAREIRRVAQTYTVIIRESL